MIYQFPVPHEDELLVSLLARFVSRQGIRDDKVALQALFGSRNVVPSALLQGHLEGLLERIGHLWIIESKDILNRHSILPVFKPFIEPARYSAIQKSLIVDAKSHSMITAGINASSLIYPSFFRFCPMCVHEDLQQRAYTYWRRQFQLPGVLVCKRHGCYLKDSGFKVKPSRRHGFIDASRLEAANIVAMAEVCQSPALRRLANDIDTLLTEDINYVSLAQWTAFYDQRLRELGLKTTQKTPHKEIFHLVENYWGLPFLRNVGLSLPRDERVSWLQTFFRKQRKHFTYLHHLVCIHSIFPECELKDIFEQASLTPIRRSTRCDRSPNHTHENTLEYRICWHRLCEQFKTLKEIRAHREGQRVYSWLYRNDVVWLKQHLPSPAKRNVGRKVDWHRRDVQLVKKLLKIRKTSEENYKLPRKTQTWFINQANVRWGVNRHLDKLLLSREFFIRYTETVMEYQLRRVLITILDAVFKDEPLPRSYEIERIAGLSARKCEELVREVVRSDYRDLPRFQVLAKRVRTNAN
jgi:hypothetical protein